MPMTLDEIVQETGRLPRQELAELIDRLTLALHHAIDPAIEEAWKQETSRRVAEIQNGRVSGIPGGASRCSDSQDRRWLKPHLFHPSASAEYADAARLKS